MAITPTELIKTNKTMHKGPKKEKIKQLTAGKLNDVVQNTYFQNVLPHLS